MSAAPILDDSIARLAKSFGGTLLRAGDAGYDEARRVHNGLIDKKPAVIARCRGVADVVDAVRLAGEQALEVAIRGGGHNVAGRATVDGGLMIDLSSMKGMHVDPKARAARAQGGMTWNGFNRETQLHGLATTGGVVSSTGIAGLTLGGGLGWLMGKHALALDNLLSAEVVLADGRVVTASAGENADLFWALRGGGGNFGVVTSFEYRLHPIGPMVTGGLIAFPFSAAWDVLRHFRDVTASLPDEISVFGGLVHAPDGSGEKLAAMVMCHCGTLAEGEAAVQPIKRFGAPALDAVGPMPYSEMNAMLDGAFPRGALNYWKSSFLASLTDEAIRTMIDCFARCPTPMGQMLLEHFHGAVTRVGVTDTAFPHRTAGYNMLVLSEWLDPGATEDCIAWARQSYDALRPFMGAGRYVNYIGEDEGSDATAAAYGPNYRRLQQVKAKYDPANVFHVNQNIRPAA
ncbi:FAD-binding oxidoreductase [Neoroseomonas soli]|uniref:FAD-binding oxidoreductase n=1 Tax=Neoroseomonas soli TaxID=1081025 RepID=A0A9X9WU35_9PROT|nr:FAD-binding oxidoreductase [Neoroseomonas soli]MBR0670664.1 FAD-binding oxidoreductase [Neoroseomonas soli]